MKNITTKQAFGLLGLINKMNLRKKLIDMIKGNTRIENKKQNILSKLYKDIENEEITNELTIKLFSENIEVYEEYKALEEEQQEIGMCFIFDIVESLPNAEKEFYKTVGTIFDKSAKEVEEMDVVDVIRDIIEIFKSESFLGFFKSMSK